MRVRIFKRMRLSWRASVNAAAVVPLLALALAAPSNALRCRLTGLVISTCCCPTGDSDQPTSVGAADCCEREQIAPLRVASELPRPAARVVVPVASAAPLLALLAPPPVLRATGARPRDGTPPRPPLVLVKHAFLI